MKFLIITSCSKRKMITKAPAINFYKGQFFSYIRIISSKINADLMVISGKYGLIPSDFIVEPYDQKCKTMSDVRRLKGISCKRLSEIISKYDKVILMCGKTYTKVLEPFHSNEKIFLTIDHRGSGGFNQIGSTLAKMEKNKLCLFYERLDENITINLINEYLTMV